MPQKRSLKAVFLNAVDMVAAGAIAGDFPMECYMCMFVWPSSPTSIKYNIQYSVRHGLVRLCGYCVYCEAEMAAGRVSAADIGHYSTNTKH